MTTVYVCHERCPPAITKHPTWPEVFEVFVWMKQHLSFIKAVESSLWMQKTRETK